MTKCLRLAQPESAEVAKSVKMTKYWGLQSAVWEGYMGVKIQASVVRRLLSQRANASFIAMFSQVWWGIIDVGRMLPIGEYTTTRDPGRTPAAQRRRRRPPPMEESMGGKGGTGSSILRLGIVRKILSLAGS